MLPLCAVLCTLLACTRFPRFVLGPEDDPAITALVVCPGTAHLSKQALQEPSEKEIADPLRQALHNPRQHEALDFLRQVVLDDLLQQEVLGHLRLALPGPRQQRSS